MEDVLEILPFRNTVVMVRIDGSLLLEALELSVSVYNPQDAEGRYLQFSGNFYDTSFCLCDFLMYNIVLWYHVSLCSFNVFLII